MTYRLMIKTHLLTGLKYLCITSRIDFENYSGSGTYWIRHIKKYGLLIETEVIFETEDPEELSDAGILYSSLFDIVNSLAWANLIPESGYRSLGAPQLFWDSISSEERINHCEKLSDSAQDFWKTLSYKEKCFRMQSRWDARKEWFENMTFEEKRNYSEKLSQSQQLRFSSMKEEDRKLFRKEMTRRRLELRLLPFVPAPISLAIDGAGIDDGATVFRAS